MNLVRAGVHVWEILDETHRECVRCELRLYRAPDGAWRLYDYFGVPGNVRVLGDGSDPWGQCKEPPPGDECLIEYTGDPDLYPGCERIMHRLEGASSRTATGAELAPPGYVARPACGHRVVFWELGATRAHIGWTPCPAPECFGASKARRPRRRSGRMLTR